MRASVVDLRRKMKQVMKALERNEEVTLLYHGKERAVIVPVREPRPRPKADIREHPAFGMLRNDPATRNVAAYIRRIRRNTRNAH